jgi:integrase
MPRVSLTDRFVAGIKATRGTRPDYFDAVVTGLSVRVSDTGRKVWWFNFTSPAGIRARCPLGNYPAIPLATARTLALEARTQLDTGTDPRVAKARQGAGKITVAELVDLYLADPQKAALRSATHLRWRLHHNVVPVIGRVELASLAKRDIRNVTDRILRRGKPTTAGHVFADLRAMIRCAVRADYLERSPIDGMERPGSHTPGERVFDDGEIATVWNGLPISLAKSKACQRILKLILATGQRPGEVAGMRRSELDLAKRLWSLPGARTKNAHPHTVPLSTLAVSIIEEALADIADDAEYLFPAGKGPLSSAALARSVGRARETTKDRPLGRFGIAAWSAHDLRRTCLTNLARLGVSPHVIAHIANHRSVTKSGVTFAVYVMHSYEGEKRAALELWADRLAAIVGGTGADVAPLRRKAAR